ASHEHGAGLPLATPQSGLDPLEGYSLPGQDICPGVLSSPFPDNPFADPRQPGMNPGRAPREFARYHPRNGEGSLLAAAPLAIPPRPCARGIPPRVAAASSILGDEPPEQCPPCPAETTPPRP